ncbi:hypothetical protein Gasu_nc0100 [Galdieria sulphuraria]|uniref:Uncharacterized protein n=1 Tax=Galdieria sulphuraria TaxID=130081 RepID=M2XRA4_GALSU|nr:hypothetical protein Gasu_nc0100 [Galdieria sulphuraria]|eukprot:XP_005702479.1 hypothetical protein Gasu_nc0100 [Galdieria sulphuraria]
MGGGAWPFLVGGVICLVNSVNERDLFLLTSYIVCEDIRYILLRGTIRFSRMEVLGNNRSVMPFDVLGCTRATLMRSNSCKRPFLRREFLVNASHQLALNTSLPFVHTARRSYRLNDPVKRTACFIF